MDDELRQRKPDPKAMGEDVSGKDDIDSDVEDKINTDKLAEQVGQDKGSEILESALAGLSPRWKNWVVRGIFTWLMIGGFGLIIWGGPPALMLTTLVVQVKCFSEIINIGYAVYRVHNLPWFRSLSWYVYISLTPIFFMLHN